MKKLLLISMLFSALFFSTQNTIYLSAQKLTVPDYSYGTIQSQYGTVTQNGVANPGPYGGYSLGEDARQSGIFLGHGYRWWGYASSPLLICGPLPKFNFPGAHGVWDNSSVACMNPPIGFMGSWGGVITDPASRSIWCLSGAKNHNGPSQPYCIPNPYGQGQICYPAPSNWSYGSSYGYLRRVFVVQSTGALQPGNQVEIKASLTARVSHEGDGTATNMGVLFLHRVSEVPWLQQGFGREYPSWGTIQDFFGSPKALVRVVIEHSGTENLTGTAVIGDTLIVEVVFNNTITHINPKGSGDAEGWSGERPSNMFTHYYYARTDSIKKLIKKHGNSLTYDLECLTQGALVTPLTSGGPNTDEDKDGISDVREKGPDGNNSSFDGNSDGIPDCKQASVASFHTYDGGNYVTLVVPSETELSQVIATANPSTADTPLNSQFPWGFFDFSIDGLDPGEAVTVSLILHNGEPVGKYYKYGITPDNLAPHWYEFMYNGQTGAEINGNIVILHFVDGMRGDEDITVNGTIKEPGGPAKSGTTYSEPLKDPAEITVYPNPASNQITLDLSNVEPGHNYRLSIYSNTGSIVFEEDLVLPDAEMEHVVITSQLPNGVYMVILSGNNYLFKGKFIKSK